MAEVNIVETPLALPYTCGSCGSTPSNKEWFIDTGLSFEWFGALYICNECFHNWAYRAGYKSDAQIKNLEVENEKLYNLSVGWEVKANALLSSIEELAKAGINVGTGNRSRIASSSEQSNVPENLELVESEPDSGENQLESGEGETSEPTDDKGMAELRSSKSASEFRLEL